MNDRADGEYNANALEASARALSEFVVRAAVLPVTFLLAKPSDFAEAHKSGDYKQLPTPFLLALVTGLLVSGVIGSLDNLDFSSGIVGSEFFRKAFEFYGSMDGAQALLFAVPFMAAVWLLAGLVSLLMFRGLSLAEPLFAGFAYSLAAIAQVAAVGIVISLWWPNPAFQAASSQFPLLAVFVIFALIVGVKLVRLVFALRGGESSAPLLATMAAAVPALSVVVLAGGVGGLYVAQAAHGSGMSQASVDRASAYMAQGDMRAAAAALDQAVEQNPLSAQALFERGNLSFQQGVMDDAMADVNRALEMEPGNAAYLSARCWMRAYAGQELNLALEDCNESLRLGPNDAITHTRRALIYLRRSEWVSAFDDYNAAAELDPQLTSARFGRGVVRFFLGEAEQGALDIQAARIADPDIDKEFARYGLEMPANLPPAAEDAVAPAEAKPE